MEQMFDAMGFMQQLRRATRTTGPKFTTMSNSVHIPLRENEHFTGLRSENLVGPGKFDHLVSIHSKFDQAISNRGDRSIMGEMLGEAVGNTISVTSDSFSYTEDTLFDRSKSSQQKIPLHHELSSFSQSEIQRQHMQFRKESLHQFPKYVTVNDNSPQDRIHPVSSASGSFDVGFQANLSPENGMPF